jgi:hypothetical protein
MSLRVRIAAAGRKVADGQLQVSLLDEEAAPTVSTRRRSLDGDVRTWRNRLAAAAKPPLRVALQRQDSPAWRATGTGWRPVVMAFAQGKAAGATYQKIWIDDQLRRVILDVDSDGYRDLDYLLPKDYPPRLKAYVDKDVAMARWTPAMLDNGTGRWACER